MDKYRKLKNDDMVNDAPQLINDNTESLRSNFSGDEYPSDPIQGQQAYIKGTMYTYNGSVWLPQNEIHNHDARYYQKNEIDTKLDAQTSATDKKLDTKAPSNHTHTQYLTDANLDALNTSVSTLNNHAKAATEGIHGSKVGVVANTLAHRGGAGEIYAGAPIERRYDWNMLINKNWLANTLFNLNYQNRTGFMAFLSDYGGGEKYRYHLSQPLHYGERGAILIHIYGNNNNGAGNSEAFSWTDYNGNAGTLQYGNIYLDENGTITGARGYQGTVRFDYYVPPWENRILVTFSGWYTTTHTVNLTYTINGDGNCPKLFWNVTNNVMGRAGLGYFCYVNGRDLRLGVALFKIATGSSYHALFAVSHCRKWHNIYNLGIL